MGASRHIVGFKPPDSKWHKMKSVYDACCAAGVGVPREVLEFFSYEEPDLAGVTVSEKVLEDRGAIMHFSGDGVDGVNIHLDKLPPGINIIRVYSSY